MRCCARDAGVLPAVGTDADGGGGWLLPCSRRSLNVTGDFGGGLRMK